MSADETSNLFMGSRQLVYASFIAAGTRFARSPCTAEERSLGGSLYFRDRDSSLCSTKARPGPSSAVHTADEPTKYAKWNQNWMLPARVSSPPGKRSAFLTFLSELNTR